MIKNSGKCYEGNKRGLRKKKIRVRGETHLDGVVKEGFSEEVTFKLKSAG